MKRPLRFSEARAFPGSTVAVCCDDCGRTLDIYNDRAPHYTGLYERQTVCWECRRRVNAKLSERSAADDFDTMVDRIIESRRIANNSITGGEAVP